MPPRSALQALSEALPRAMPRYRAVAAWRGIPACCRYALLIYAALPQLASTAHAAPLFVFEAAERHAAILPAAAASARRAMLMLLICMPAYAAAKRCRWRCR